MREDGRDLDAIRNVSVIPHYLTGPEGSVLISAGDTRVLCSVSFSHKLPYFLKDENRGWLKAEYAMLPGSSAHRIPREVSRGHVSGRTAEIQRLISRSLRSVIDFSLIPQITVLVDCDVIQADGGTRTLSITGACIALHLAFEKLIKERTISKNPLKDSVAAVSVGIKNNECLLDICYEEDFQVDVDMNIVMTGSGKFIEVQGTAEGNFFDRKSLDKVLSLAELGIKELTTIQKRFFE